QADEFVAEGVDGERGVVVLVEEAAREDMRVELAGFLHAPAAIEEQRDLDGQAPRIESPAFEERDLLRHAVFADLDIFGAEVGDELAACRAHLESDECQAGIDAKGRGSLRVERERRKQRENQCPHDAFRFTLPQWGTARAVPAKTAPLAIWPQSL